MGADRPEERVVAGGEVVGPKLSGVDNLWVYEKEVSGPAGVRMSALRGGHQRPDPLDRLLRRGPSGVVAGRPDAARRAAGRPGPGGVTPVGAGETAGPDPAPPAAHRTVSQRWEARDPELRATKRSVRAAVLVPGVFALADFGIGNAQTTLFAVFGSFALLLFADFGGATAERLRSYIGLFVAGAVLIIVGTLCSSHPAPAVIGMAVFGFAVLFAGVVSPQAAVGATAALLTFVLPVAVPAGASAVGSRLAGWALAGAFCIPAVMLVWSGRWHDPLRRKAARRRPGGGPAGRGPRRGVTSTARRERACDGPSRRCGPSTRPRPTGRPAPAPPTPPWCGWCRGLEWVGENALVPRRGPGILEDDGPVRQVHGAWPGSSGPIASLLVTGRTGP